MNKKDENENEHITVALTEREATSLRLWLEEIGNWLAPGEDAAERQALTRALADGVAVSGEVVAKVSRAEALALHAWLRAFGAAAPRRLAARLEVLLLKTMRPPKCEGALEPVLVTLATSSGAVVQSATLYAPSSPSDEVQLATRLYRAAREVYARAAGMHPLVADALRALGDLQYRVADEIKIRALAEMRVAERDAADASTVCFATQQLEDVEGTCD